MSQPPAVGIPSPYPSAGPPQHPPHQGGSQPQGTPQAPPPAPLGFLELTLDGAEATPEQKQREPTGADPYAVLHYGSKQFFVARLMKGLKFSYRVEEGVTEILVLVYDAKKPEPRTPIASISIPVTMAIGLGVDEFSCPIVKAQTSDVLGHIKGKLRTTRNLPPPPPAAPSEAQGLPASQPATPSAAPASPGHVPGVAYPPLHSAHPGSPSPPQPSGHPMPPSPGSAEGVSPGSSHGPAAATAAVAGAASGAAAAAAVTASAAGAAPDVGHAHAPSSAITPYSPHQYPGQHPNYAPPSQQPPPHSYYPYPHYPQSSYYPSSAYSYPYSYGYGGYNGYYPAPPTVVVTDCHYGRYRYGYGGRYGCYGGSGYGNAMLGAGAGLLGGALLGAILF